MKYIVYIALAAAAYLGMGKFYFFSPTQVEKFLANHQMNMMKGADDICDVYADNITISIDHQDAQQAMTLSGGKKEMCDYAKSSGEVMRTMQANVSTRIDNMQVDTAFPWLTATADYNETSSISMQGVPPMTMTMKDKVQLKRTLTGVEITYLSSVGRAQ